MGHQIARAGHLARSNPSCRPVRRAFTLVELLVVIGIIALLISILLPSLSRARREGQRIKCLSNLRQIGTALFSYQNDNRGCYPVHTMWGNLLGRRGTLDRYDDAGFTGFNGEPGTIGDRPLNPYLGSPEIARCPDDRGDSFSGGDSFAGVVEEVEDCFEAYGTSYLVQWHSDAYGVEHVTGTPGSSVRRPMRAGRRGDTSIKIVMGDWNWHANRPLDAPRTRWHDVDRKGDPAATTRRHNMLFADGHAEAFMFPASYDRPPVNASLDQTSTAGVAPDAARGYW